ncbi:conjugal transfer protein TraH [Candidatus Neptunochlamydia vexilliferae]|uniref:Uncharacterized protein n=1 Tax=Candidatus Neptunichlamydia vexilliferae TaxID=1651774 RepID=A0ABS0AYN2_9BACT|nr:conjugal transfer protein TraH [Candidatus Neptunochlamydia vexilliferae]MBF5059070.1 hypothetical protein [Candidatus Neptunochlamydia vexilliferae]
MKKLLLLSMLCLTPFLPAKEKKSLSGKIQEFFDQTNTPANITEADTFYDDVIGVNFIGGSGFVRTQVSDINPVHISLPKINVGCGGIDYTMGALNIVSKEEMVKTLKNIAKNAGTHAFLLALETTSPLVAGTLAKIQHWSNQLNAININSCEIGSSLVQGIWPRSEEATRYICSQTGSKEGLFSGMIEARHGCRDRADNMTTAALNHAKKEGALIENYNLAWEVIKDLNITDPTVRNLYLNISGTILKQQNTLEFFPSKAEAALDVLMNGGELHNAYLFGKVERNLPMSVYKNHTIQVSSGHSEKDRIWTLLRTLQSKILKEGLEDPEPLTEKEKEMITSTQFPISSLMVLMGQWEGKNVEKHLSLRQCAEIIAFERVTNYVEEIVKTLILRTEAIQSKQIEQESFETFKKGLEQTLTRIERLKSDNYRKMSEKQKMIQFLMDIERNLRDRPGANL